MATSSPQRHTSSQAAEAAGEALDEGLIPHRMPLEVIGDGSMGKAIPQLSRRGDP